MVLSSGDLEYMRTAQEDLLPDTCTIQTNTRTRSVFGGETTSWADAATAVPCRLVRVDPRLRNELNGAQEQLQADWWLTLHHDQTIALGQRVVVNSLTLEPVDINEGRSWQIVTRVLCREVSAG